MAKVKVNCVNCGKGVERYPSQILGTVFCSRGCRSDYLKKHNTITFDCHFCGKEKRINKTAFNREGNNFCSRKCKDKWQSEGLRGSANPFFNKRHSDETKRKVSETKKAMKLTGERAHNYNSHPVECAECGKVTYKIKYLIDRSQYLFCSVDCHGAWKSKYNIGEANPNWNPELTPEERERGRKYPEYYDFLRTVMKRDNYSCQICATHGDTLNVHHLNSYDWDKENRTNPDNGITLCKTCHTDFHMKYGYGKNTREQFNEYLRKLAC